MKSNRRKFLQNIGTSAAVISLPSISNAAVKSENSEIAKPKTNQAFNMCGFAAPKLDKVRIGFIGLGNRGPGAVKRMSQISAVEIVALCDKDPARVEKQQAVLSKSNLPKAREYSGVDGWKGLCESNDIDLVYICTPWSLHTPMAVYAMNNGKHAAIEVPAAKTIDECWQLVETSKKPKNIA